MKTLSLLLLHDDGDGGDGGDDGGGDDSGGGGGGGGRGMHETLNSWSSFGLEETHLHLFRTVFPCIYLSLSLKNLPLPSAPSS